LTAEGLRLEKMQILELKKKRKENELEEGTFCKVEKRRLFHNSRRLKQMKLDTHIHITLTPTLVMSKA
jgi:hypothetical protein